MYLILNRYKYVLNFYNRIQRLNYVLAFSNKKVFKTFNNMTTVGTNNDKIIYIPRSDYIPDPKGLGNALFTYMKQYKDKIAQIDAVTEQKDTYSSLLQRCIQTAIKIRSLGVGPGDIVSTCTFNHLNSCVPYLATLFLGAKISNFDPTLSVQDMVHLLKQVTPKIIFVAPEVVGLIEDVVKELDNEIIIVVFGHTIKHMPFSEFLRSNPEEITFQPYAINDLKETALIFFSSGTTGLPKGICINHYAYMHQQMNIVNMGFCMDITLGFSSLYWITPSVFFCAIIFAGTTRLVIPKFDPVFIWKSIKKFKPTFMYGIPFHFLSLVEAKPFNVDVHSIKHIATGGGHLLINQIQKISETFPKARVFGGYGQTEMAMFITTFRPNLNILEKPTSCGTGVPGISYKVVDLDTEEILGPNQLGELRLKTDYCLNGYYNIDASDCWDNDGWYRTNDLVYYDEDNCFYVVDRLKEFLKFQSWHVPPSLLENILTSHTNIANAIVIGLPHDIDECHIMALVVLKDSSTKTTAEEIEKFVEEKVDDRKRLRGGVKIIEKLPLTETGKLQRRKIRDMYLRGEI